MKEPNNSLRIGTEQLNKPPLEEDILSFIRDLGHTGEIKFLYDVNVNHMHQTWRSFGAIINKCLSGKTTALESLRLSRAQILWGMYHNKKVDYVYLLWEDLDQAIPRQNKMFWHHARDDFMFTTVRVIPKPQDTQVYGAWKRIFKKRTKTKLKMDKTEHGMEKCEKTKSN
ncbi:hypothetical protein Tco_1323603 [Tanacetum coccineum]